MLRWFAIALALVSCESAPRSLPEGPAAPQSAHTRDQLVAANDLQLAVAQGRLSDARDLAVVLASDMPADVQQPAQRISHVDDLAAAGLELGRLAGACGGCHAKFGVSAAIPPRTAPAEAAGLTAQMARHAWGATRLWEGVTGPAEHAWIDGAVVIAKTPCDIQTVMRGKPNVRAFELAEQLREQAIRAGGAAHLEARANLYGEVMSTCASCHQILRPQPVVDPHRDAVARSR
jgi:mono/diheme cytochrome c family protein